MTTWFIADLHLHPSRPEMDQALLTFLQYLQYHPVDALYILGDLFEYWLGDDVLTHPLGEPILPLVKALRALSNQHKPVYFQHGNRDFLLGESFARHTGVTLLPEQYVIDLYGKPTLILHGDLLCTDDTDYQQLRVLLRHPAWQQQFLALSIEERWQQAKALRQQSQTSMQQKDEQILDVNQESVMQAMQAAGVTQLIHGHTHRPYIHQWQQAKATYQRVVLGDWYQQASYLRVSATDLLLSESYA